MSSFPLYTSPPTIHPPAFELSNPNPNPPKPYNYGNPNNNPFPPLPPTSPRNLPNFSRSASFPPLRGARTMGLPACRGSTNSRVRRRRESRTRWKRTPSDYRVTRRPTTVRDCGCRDDAWKAARPVGIPKSWSPLTGTTNLDARIRGQVLPTALR